MSKASLVQNKNNNIDIVIEPVKDELILTEKVINELIASSEYKDLDVIKPNIKKALSELNDALKLLARNDSGKYICFEILERKDASINIKIDNDEMSATAEISTALGGKHLTAKEILDCARESGVLKGFSKDKLLKLAKVATVEAAGTLVKARIAIGKPAKNGKNAKMKPLVESAQNRILRPKERDDGSVDMRDLGDIICVKVGDPLMQKLPPTQGIEGYKVTGSPLSPTAGEDVDIIAGEGTVVSRKNSNVLISTLVGLPKIIDNGMEVDPVYKIKGVNANTGHINFEGSVIISGDINEGMRVIATGDITVSGFVESAYLDAGGDITITSGVIGKKQDVENNNISEIKMSTVINAKGSIYAKHCQYVELNSQSDVIIENQLMHSIVNVDGKLWVGSQGQANGKLIAGFISAGTSVHAGIVGASAGNPTIIEFEKNILKFNAKIQRIDERLTVESDKTEELRKASNKLKALPKEKKKPELLKKIIQSYQYHAKRMGEIMLAKDKMEQRLQSFMESVKVEATDTLYEGVEVFIGEYTDKSRRQYGPSRMIYKDRKVIIDAIIGH